LDQSQPTLKTYYYSTMEKVYLIQLLRKNIYFAVSTLVALAILCVSPLKAQVTLGNDTVLCNGEPFTLTATTTAGLESTSYTITSIPFAPHPIAGSTVSLTDDAVSGVFPIGFSFCFLGTSYSNFYIGSNGWISFTAGQSAAYTSASIPNTGANVPKNCIMGPWQDWNPGIGGTIRYQTQGTAPFRRLVVTWDNVPMFSCTGNLGKFQIVCYETTSVIENHIWNKPNCTGWAGGTAVQGLHNLAGTQAFVVPGRNSTQWTATNDARRYTPNGLSWYANGVFVGSDFSITIDPEVTTEYVATAILCNNTSSSDTLVVTVGLPLSFSTTEVTTTECTEATGSISVGIETDSEGPFTYQWADPINSNETELTGLDEGFYTLSITDDVTGCAIDTTFEITTEYQIFVFTEGSDINCADGSDGIATASASNGTGSYTYEWNDPQSQEGQTANNLNVGTYTVTVTDDIGCTETASVEISAPAALAINVDEAIYPLCFGDISGTATVSVEGGVGGYLFEWSNGTEGQTISGVGAGQYFVGVTDSNGCEGELQVNIIQPQPINPNEIIQDPTCDGFVDGYIQLDPIGGTAPFTFFWPQSGNTGSLEENLTVGLYEFVVTDDHGCVYEGSIELQPTAPMVLQTNTTDISCFGEDDGIGIADVSGGTPGYTYLWNDDQDQTGATATDLEPGTYSVVVTDAFGCQQTATITIAEPLQLNATIISNTDALCNNEGGGTATVSAQGGQPGYTYLWSNGETTETATDLSGGSAVVTVTDNNGCTDVVSVVIDEPAELEGASIGVNPECPNGTDGSATINMNGGVPPYSYDWDNGGSAAAINNLGGGQYTVLVTDANGCEFSSTVVLGEPNPIETNINVDDASCGDNDGSASAAGTSGGTSPYTYSWSGTGQTGNSADNLTSGNYTLVITDSNGCTESENFSVGEINFPNASISASTTEGPQPLTVTFTNNSTNGDVFFWDFGDGNTENTDNITSVINTFENDGSYDVILVVTSPGGCIDTAFINVFVFSDSYLAFPNVFTPNVDSDNITFKPIVAMQLRSYELIIFDRWGTELFRTSDTSRGWTGKNEGGIEMAEGTYYYVIAAEGFDGKKFDKGGNLTLLR
jgi:gliding motility-associated-like protein